jgi:cytochrome P450
VTDIDPAPDRTAPPACPAHDKAVALAGLEYQQTPSELYRGLRAEHGAVAPVLLDGSVPAWLVLGYAEVSYVTSHDELFARDSRRWNQWDAIPPDWPLLPYVGYQPSVLFTEGVEHRRRAGVISQALAGVDQFELARDCRQLADGLIAAFAGSGRAELMADYAHALPMRAAVRMCGSRTAATTPGSSSRTCVSPSTRRRATTRSRPTRGWASASTGWCAGSGSGPDPTSPRGC